MDSGLPDASSGTPHSQGIGGIVQPNQQQQPPSLLTVPSEENTPDESERPSSRRTSSQSTLHDQVRETKDVDIPRSFTPPGGSSSGSVKYTRTGRVSKAAKGQRIHACHIEGCDKVFSRAEHLRRHQKNHQPGDFACDFPGCTRTFARQDLLIRHRARHNEPYEESSRRPSSGSPTSAPGDGPPYPLSAVSQATSFGSIAPTSAPVAADFGGDVPRSEPAARTPPKRRPIPPNELAIMPRLPVEVYGPFAGMEYNPWNDSPPLESVACDFDSSPEVFGLSYFQDQNMRATDSSLAAMLEHDGSLSPSTSPASDNSPTMNPSWHPLPLPVYEIPLTEEDLSCAALPHSSPTPMTSLTRCAIEQQFGLLDLIPSEEDLEIEKRHIDAYFAWTHDQLPVLHKPTFLLRSRQETPLLRASVLALGGQALGRSSDIAKAHLLHDRCVKILENRTAQGTHTYRISDMQAIVLVEVYSLFLSRNPPAYPSQNLTDVYRILSDDHEATRSNSNISSATHDFSLPDLQTIQRFCKQRLLLACYLLYQQHSLLFNSAIPLSLHPLNLPFPTPQIQWDSPFSIPHPSLNFPNLSEALVAVVDLTPSPAAKNYHDAFQSLLLISTFMDLETDPDVRDVELLHAIEPSPRMKLTFHSMKLCKNSPIGDLLQILSREKDSENTVAKSGIRKWAAGQMGEAGMCISTAVHHAIKILEIQREESRTGVIFQEWAVFLAGVVVWARGYFVGGKGGDCGGGDGDGDDVESEDVAGRVLDEILEKGSIGDDDIGEREAISVLLWVKMEIELHSQREGLVGRGLDMLGKLIERGSEVGWF